MALITIGAVAAHFGRDVDRGVSKVVGIVDAHAASIPIYKEV